MEIKEKNFHVENLRLEGEIIIDSEIREIILVLIELAEIEEIGIEETPSILVQEEILEISILTIEIIEIEEEVEDNDFEFIPKQKP